MPSSPRLCPQLKYAYESPVKGFMLLSPLSPENPPPPPALAGITIAINMQATVI
jgi:hypothetical protein